MLDLSVKSVCDKQLFLDVSKGKLLISSTQKPSLKGKGSDFCYFGNLYHVYVHYVSPIQRIIKTKAIIFINSHPELEISSSSGDFDLIILDSIRIYSGFVS